MKNAAGQFCPAAFPSFLRCRLLRVRGRFLRRLLFDICDLCVRVDQVDRLAGQQIGADELAAAEGLLDLLDRHAVVLGDLAELILKFLVGDGELLLRRDLSGDDAGTHALFGLLGAYQLIQSRSLKKVDRTLLALGVLYLVVIILYVFFNKAVVNYRPVLTDGELEASYPSSHTMLAVTVMGSAAMVMERVIRDRKLRKIVQRVCIFILILTVVSRLLSGVHWFTDILGSLLLSSALLMLFYAVLCMWKRPLKRGREEEY